jgi:hypothetical protein
MVHVASTLVPESPIYFSGQSGVSALLFISKINSRILYKHFIQRDDGAGEDQQFRPGVIIRAIGLT